MSRRRRPQSLTAALAAFLGRTLLPDLKARTADPAVATALAARWRAERDAGHTAATQRDYIAQLTEQIGAAWILGVVFVRTAEDRDLVARRRLAGPGSTDSEQLFFELFPRLGARDYLRTAFRELARLPGAAELLGPATNPAFRLAPRDAPSRARLELLRENTDDGALRFRFAGEGTRFLGDLYQDLSEAVRKRYALLQTPPFVEAFILDRTLEPALAEFGLDDLRLIDPACGSGHFLLGAYDRLVEHRRRRWPGATAPEHARAALAQLFGTDINPYAIAIARFRLTLAYLRHAGLDRLDQAPRLPLNLCVADSLLHGSSGEALRFADLDPADEAWGDRLFALDEPDKARAILGQRYHAVVANPPYITCKDKALRDAYRERYTACYREYALSAPFCERIFDLAVPGGFTGQITANSFMKREFGKKLVQEVLPHLDLTEVIDTSGAFIPGHGTPTVLLFGRNRRPAGDTVPAVLGKRGEPSTPADPEQGLVWSAIRDHAGEIGHEDDYISVAAVPRATFAQHPWSLGGGGAAELKALLEKRAENVLGDIATAIGRTVHTGEDNVFVADAGALERAGISKSNIVTFVEGKSLRDWANYAATEVLFPYDSDLAPATLEPGDPLLRWVWPYRTLLARRVNFGQNMEERGMDFHEFSMFFPDRYRTPLSIAFAFVATHNHFVLDRGGKVFNRSAPIIKLPPEATEADHLALLGYLNSSVACFWMKQVSQNKGATSDSGVLQSDPTKFRFEFDASKLKRLPVPRNLLSYRGGLIKRLARGISELQSRNAGAAICESILSHDPQTLAQKVMDEIHQAHQRDAVSRALQNDLDWAVLDAVGLLGCPASDLVHVGSDSSTCGIDHPAVGPTKEIADARLRSLRENENVQLVFRPEYRRRWHRSAGKFSSEEIGVAEHIAECLVGGSLDDVETLFEEGVPLSASKATMILGASVSWTTRLAVLLDLQNDGDRETLDWLTRSLLDEAVPHLAALRFKPAGLEKHARWREVWALQRREDAGENVGPIAVPPKYKSGDYTKSTYWRLRGKLDVPKERFIHYVGAERDDDPSPVFGWAGWDHLQRARALAGLYEDRKTNEGWGPDRLVPLLAGLEELIFWLELWHDEPDPAYGGERMGQYFARHVETEARALGLSVADLRAWRPPARGRRKRGSKA